MSAMRARIVDLYGPKVLRKSALNIREGGGVFREVLEGKGYGTVLEIGTHRGCAAAEMSQYCERVVTIDLIFGQLERNGEHFDRRGFWKSLGIHNIDLHLVRDDDEKRGVVRQLAFDLAFIDGAHDHRVALDFEITRHCGRVLFHDADHSPSHDRNVVHDFIKRAVPRDQVRYFDQDIFAYWERP